MRPDHSSITERPGELFTTPQLIHMRQRYALAAAHAEGRDVLEAACGAGFGFSVLDGIARRFVAGDVNEANLVLARQLHGTHVPVLQFDAEALPFADESFDLVLLLEAIYYLADPSRAAAEAFRVLRSGGRFVVCSVNPAWRDFGASPLSSRYLDSRELVRVLGDAGFHVSLFGGFAPSDSVAARALSWIRRTSSRLQLPWPLGVKRLVRRMLYGVARPEPSITTAGVADLNMVELDLGIRDERHAILYVVAVK